MKASDGSVWFICLLTNVVRLSYENSKWTTYERLLIQCETWDGTIWFISQDGEVVSKDSKSGFWSAYGTEDGLIDCPVALFVTRKNELWAVGSHQGVAATAQFRHGTWNKKVHHQFSWGIDFRSVCEGEGGELYFGARPHQAETQGGILKFSLDAQNQPTWEHYVFPENAKNCTGLAFTSDGLLWFGGHNLLTYPMAG
jgi:ligand-binding sensor domain-containing protein